MHYWARRIGADCAPALRFFQASNRAHGDTRHDVGRRVGCDVHSADSGVGVHDIVEFPAPVLCDNRGLPYKLLTRQDMDMITNIVAKLDVGLAQVLIEAIILDVTLGDDLTLGVSAGQQPKNLHGSVVGGGSINNGSGSLNSGLQFLNSFLSAAGTNAVATGFPSTDGLTYFTKIGPTWNVALTA